MVSFRGIGQAPDSEVTGTAAWLSSVCAILSKDATFGPILNDPYAARFAEAISPDAPALLAEYDDDDIRTTYIETRERELPGVLTVVAYRKPIMERMAREALERTGADQMVIMVLGCDTLALRLARSGLKPRVYEVDRPGVIDFRERVIAELPLDAGHIQGVGVDFDHKTFGEALLETGYDPAARTVFFAEGLLGYVQPEAVDEIFRFIKQRAAPGSRFVFSFTERRRAGAERRISTAADLEEQGEPAVFDLTPAETPEFVRSRGFKLIELLAAPEMRETYRSLYGGRIRILPFLHLAVAES